MDSTTSHLPTLFFTAAIAVVLGMMVTGSIAAPLSQAMKDDLSNITHPCGNDPNDSSESSDCDERSDSCDILAITLNFTRTSLRRIQFDNPTYFNETNCASVNLKDQTTMLLEAPENYNDCNDYRPLQKVLVSHQYQLWRLMQNSQYRDIPNNSGVVQLSKNLTTLNCIFMCRCRGITSTNVSEILDSLPDMFANINNTTTYKTYSCIISSEIRKHLDLIGNYSRSCNL